MLKKLLLSILLAGACLSPALAENLNSPLGSWITISDKTHDAAAVINLYEEQGKIKGKIVKIFPGSGRNPDELCKKCPAGFKDQRVLGMTFLWGFEQQSQNTWGKGHILDPKEGSIYRCTMQLVDNGSHLKVRGYWGPFWRTQTWNRAVK